MATFSVQNRGTNKVGRIRQSVRLSASASLVFSLLLAVLVRYVGSNMIVVFVKGGNPFIIDADRRTDVK